MEHGHLSFAPDYLKYALEKRDQAHISLIEYTQTGMIDPSEFNKDKVDLLRHLLMKFKGAAESYQFHEAREKQGNRYENSYKVHAKDMDLIQSLIQLIDEVPSVPIGKVFPKLIKLVNPSSPFEAEMQSMYKHFEGDLERPLNQPNWKQKQDDNSEDNDE